LRARGSSGAPLSRIATHIPGLDGALHGGVPQGSVVLIAGAPGTMKTSLALFILANNAISDLRGGLYITFGERAASLFRQMETMGLDFSRVEGRLEILDATLLWRSVKRGKRDWLNDLKGRLKALAGAHLQLLVIDSLEALEVLAKFENRRVELFRLFEWLRDLGLTSFVIAERPDFIIRGNVFQGRHDEDFLADGMIQLRLHSVTDVQIQRRIRIVKMRGTAHDTGYMAFHVAPGKEFEVAPAIGA
jgi:circadian clock protein KaiC